MDVGIGLPSTIPGVTGDELIEWSRRADARGFSTLGTIDRIAYPNLESLVSLAAAAAVTERIGLTTSILIAPYRANAALLAKQAASIQRISAGRLTLGVAVGGREDDYSVSGVDFGTRGKRFEQMLEQMTTIWAESGDPGPGRVGPPDPPRLVIGGYVDATFKRVAKYGAGYIAGGAPPDAVAGLKAKLDDAWREAGREGEPYVGALAYFSLGAGAAQNARAYLGDYYAWLGEETANQIGAGAAKDGETAKAYVQAYADAGANELILFPSSTDPEQVDLLAEAVL
jgi:alkanesulfonate monooxygenase SsuD/methylene tetrahydromethanopterin reductase-like flavin-dependent oxidoreductase (luciferase family)